MSPTFPRKPRWQVEAMLIKFVDQDGRPGYLTANPDQIAGAGVTINHEAEYNEFRMYPWDDPRQMYTGHQRITVEVDGLNGYTMTEMPPGNWQNRPELTDPSIVEEDTNGEDSGPRALPRN